MSGTWISKPGTQVYELQVKALEKLLTEALDYLDHHPEHEGCFYVTEDESSLYTSQKKRLI